jgi:citronellol/citronellal dehydrogenase
MQESCVTEFDHYRFDPGSDAKLMTDLFID